MTSTRQTYSKNKASNGRGEIYASCINPVARDARSPLRRRQGQPLVHDPPDGDQRTVAARAAIKIGPAVASEPGTQIAAGENELLRKNEIAGGRRCRRSSAKLTVRRSRGRWSRNATAVSRDVARNSTSLAKLTAGSPLPNSRPIVCSAQPTPCDIEPGEIEEILSRGDDGVNGEFAAARLVKKMLAAGVSRFELDPPRALAEAKEAHRKGIEPTAA